MKSIVRTLGVCVFALGASAFAASNQPAKPGSEPVYNPATVVDVDGVITGVRQVPAGSALEGMHLTVKSKSGSIDVYLGPTAFMRIFHTDFPVGAEVEVIGSKVKFQNNDVILTRDVAIGAATINLRDASGAENWKNWGVEADPTALQY